MAMPIKNIIKRVLLILSIPAIIGTYFAFNYMGKNNPLQAVKINILGNNATRFVTQQSMMESLITNKNIVPKATSIKFINVHEIESTAKSNPWIQSAEAYINNSGILQINIEPREPVLRLLSNDGLQYYLDAEAKIIPMHETISADVPVVSATELGLNLQDQNIRKQAVALCNYISKDSFWNAMLTQININSNKEFELITAIAEHTILFGDTSNMADKFNRIYMYYKLAIPKVGYDAYAVLNVKNVGQIVGVKNTEAELLDIKNNNKQSVSNTQNTIKSITKISKPIAIKKTNVNVIAPIINKIKKPTVSNTTTKPAVVKVVPKPIVKQATVQTSKPIIKQIKQTPVNNIAKPIVKPIAKPVAKPVEKPVEKTIPKPIIKKVEIVKPSVQKSSAAQIAKPKQVVKNTNITKPNTIKKPIQKVKQ